ncbi:peptidoglycan D,D-transpeptidase FtsI family protein [Chungangia koreensis]|uniref:Peptidoglycan D,D-transpeptidase FtsI family protein n=1 Tax=Chungangia koreensis TaxID=752657 RepID=A0ABV8X7X9_9LACT
MGRLRKSTKKRKSLKAKQRQHIAFRMNILFFSIFILFSLLIFRLGYLQIVKGEDYVRALERTEEIPVNTSVPRGRIYDKYGRILVDNEPKNAITYTKMQDTKQTDMLEIAKKLAKLIDLKSDRVTLRDKQDFWITNNRDAAYEKVPEDEQKEIQAIEDLSEKEVQQEIDKRVRERITQEELDTLTETDLEVLAIYREMLSGYALAPQIIKSDVEPAEFARVSERLGELPGVNTTTDWERVKNVPKGTVAILGGTTTPQKGIPADKLDYFLARGYSRNDRVGTSYLEFQYEEVLQGQKTVVKNLTNSKGQVVDTVPVIEGKPGKDLVLTIDSELQLEVEKIVEKNLLDAKKKPGTKYLDRAFIIMMDPKTGDVLSMVGKQLYKDEAGKTQFLDYSYGSFTTAYEAGSVVKPATILTAYQNDIIEPGTTLIDEPIKLAGTNGTKSSVFNRSGRIPVNDLYAIERSSNVYMFKIALLSAGLQYTPNMPLRVMPEKLNLFRSGFSQFGLGVNTGIDLPNEVTGVQSDLKDGGNLLDYTIGQFDTYTPLQLAQYVSTIANGGYRIQPHIVKEIREPSEDGVSMGPVIQEIGPVILNRVNNSDNEINRIKEGMKRVYYGDRGSARSWFKDTDYVAAGKTGTAQSFAYDEKEKKVHETLNVSHIGFAPFDNPEVAYAIVVPYVTTDDDHTTYVNNMIARQALDKYFELKEKNMKNGLMEEAVPQPIKPSITDVRIQETEEEEETITTNPEN